MLRNLILVSFLNICKLLIQSLIAIVIALFTTPDRYGLIGFSLPVVTFLILVGTAGIAPAVIRQQALTNKALGASLTLGLAISACMAIGLLITAPILEREARLPGLTSIVSALSLVLIPAIAAETLRAALERDLRYRSLLRVELAAMSLAVLAAMLAAAAGTGIWTLVVYHLVLHCGRAAGMLVALRKQVEPNFEWRLIRSLVLSGSLPLAANLCNFAARNTDNLLIGASFGSRALGLYAIAYQLMTLPLIAIAWPASNLLLATLKRITPADRGQFGQAVKDMLVVTAALAFPLAAWLSTALPWLAQRFLRPLWLDSVGILGVLAPAGALQSLAAFTGAILLARDRSRLNLAMSALNCLVLLGGFTIGLHFTLRGFVLIYVVLSSLMSVWQISVLARVAGLRMRALLRALAPAMTGASSLAVLFLMLGRYPVGLAWWSATNLIAMVLLGGLYARFYPQLIGSTLQRFGAGRRVQAAGR